jgi:anti-sigma factor RsiW
MTLLAEDDLHAYLDGELNAEQRAAVEAWLAEDPTQAERLRLWTEQKDGLHRLFDPVLDEPLPPRLSVGAITRQQHPLRRALPRLAAALALLALGGLGGWALRGVLPAASGTPPAAMVAEALSAHRVFVAEIRHPVEVAVSERAHLVGWLSKRLGTEVKVPDLEPAGFALMGGRLLPASSGPAAQFMYESKTGQRVTLYLRHNEGGTVTAFKFASQNGIEAFYWLDGPFGYALVADLPRDQLLPLAKAVYHQIEE